jgi:hypothetical protein
MNEAQTLLIIKFGTGKVTYLTNGNDFWLDVEGRLFPRQFKAANEIVQIYNDCSKLDNGGRST